MDGEEKAMTWDEKSEKWLKILVLVLQYSDKKTTWDQNIENTNKIYKAMKGIE